MREIWTGKTYYRDLGIDKDAGPEEVKRAYRRMAKRYHPDIEGGSEARFKKINEAQEVLQDPMRRREYDEQMAEESIEAKKRVAEEVLRGEAERVVREEEEKEREEEERTAAAWLNKQRQWGRSRTYTPPPPDDSNDYNHIPPPPVYTPPPPTPPPSAPDPQSTTSALDGMFSGIGPWIALALAGLFALPMVNGLIKSTSEDTVVFGAKHKKMAAPNQMPACAGVKDFFFNIDKQSNVKLEIPLKPDCWSGWVVLPWTSYQHPQINWQVQSEKEFQMMVSGGIARTVPVDNEDINLGATTRNNYFNNLDALTPGEGFRLSGNRVANISISAPKRSRVSEIWKHYPRGEMLVLRPREKKGVVTVKNFFLANPEVLEATTILLATGHGWEIDFQVDANNDGPTDQMLTGPFYILTRSEPGILVDADVTADAKKAFLNLLGISAEDACKLDFLGPGADRKASFPINFGCAQN